MATYTSKAMVDELIANNGDDPEAMYEPIRVVKVVEYTGRGGETCWGCVYRAKNGRVIEDETRYEQPTDYVINPRVIWERR